MEWIPEVQTNIRVKTRPGVCLPFEFKIKEAGKSIYNTSDMKEDVKEVMLHK